MILNGLKKKIEESGIPRMFKNERSRKFCYKGGKRTIVLLYPKTYVNKERSHINRKVGLRPRLARVKEMAHDMLNMPMKESCLIWPLKQLLYMFLGISQIESIQT